MWRLIPLLLTPVQSFVWSLTVADPGFPVGGEDRLEGHGPPTQCFLMKMYAKTKDLGPLRRVCAGHAPLRFANDFSSV